VIARKVENYEGRSPETTAERARHRVAKARAEALANRERVSEWVAALKLLRPEAPVAAADALRELRAAVARLLEAIDQP
jgi:hypothetical protein